MQNNASRIGFRGTEDLGGGLKAGFVLEHGFNINNGTQSQSAIWARQSEVNLGGNWGMVRLGNLGAGFQKANPTDSNANQFARRALYELGAFTVGGYVQRDKDGFGDWAAAPPTAWPACTPSATASST
jgi:predicted porin